jgi:hypothetical protein
MLEFGRKGVFIGLTYTMCVLDLTIVFERFGTGETRSGGNGLPPLMRQAKGESMDRLTASQLDAMRRQAAQRARERLARVVRLWTGKRLGDWADVEYAQGGRS